MRLFTTLWGVVLFALLCLGTSHAQNVGIGTASPQTRLDVAGEIRIGSTGQTAASAGAGALRWFGGALQFSDGAAWLPISGPLGWALTGNAATNPATNFLGTTDAQPLVVRTNNTERLRVLSGGNVGINTATPGTLLHVVGGVGGPGPLTIGNIAQTPTSSTVINLPGFGEDVRQTFNSGPGGTLNSIQVMVSGGSLPSDVALDFYIGSVPIGGTPVQTIAGTFTAPGAFTFTFSPSLVLAPATIHTFRVRVTTSGDPAIATGGNYFAGGTQFFNGMDMLTDLVFQANLVGAAAIGNAAFFQGNVAVGNVAPTSLLDVGSANQFRVDGTGNLIRINNVPYSWPAVQGGAGQVLTNNGAGTLSWAAAAAPGWSLTGNSGTSTITNYLGTADFQDLVIRTNATERMRVSSGGNVGIGTATPAQQLHLTGIIRVNTLAGVGNRLVEANATGDLVVATQRLPLRGRIASNGSLLSSNGLSATRIGVGTYNVTITTPFAAAPSVVATVEEAVGGPPPPCSNTPAPTCAASHSSGCTSGDLIDNFSTTAGSTNITNNASGCSAGSYGNFTGMTVTVPQAGAFNVNMQSGPTWGQGFRVWVDWNQNGLFEAAESMYASPTSGTGVFTGSIAVPVAVNCGIYRMRVRCTYFTVPANTEGCGVIPGFGETEDYTVVVTAATLPGSPAGVAVVNSPSAGAFQVRTYSFTGALQDSGFNVIVSGQ